MPPPNKSITVTYTFSIPERGLDSTTVRREAVDPATELFKKFTKMIGTQSSLKVVMTPDNFKSGGSSIM